MPEFNYPEGAIPLDPDVRQRYIAALQAADDQNYEPLQEFVRT